MGFYSEETGYIFAGWVSISGVVGGEMERHREKCLDQWIVGLSAVKAVREWYAWIKFGIMILGGIVYLQWQGLGFNREVAGVL